MPFSVQFPNPLNKSVKVGDKLFYSKPTSRQSGMNHPTPGAQVTSSPICIGTISAINVDEFHKKGSITSGSNQLTINSTFTPINPSIAGIHARGVTKGTRVSSLAVGPPVVVTMSANATKTLSNIDVMIHTSEIVVNSPLLNVTLPASATLHHYFFAKDDAVNQVQLIGYYAQVELINKSRKRAEIHQITTDFYESSR